MSKWGIDILAIRQMKYFIVAIEYFTKWIEAEPVAQITANRVQHFCMEEYCVLVWDFEAFNI